MRTLGRAVDLAFSRIQFTPDMMPADIRARRSLIETEGGGHKLEFRGDRWSPTSCSPTKSTARRPRRSRRCSGDAGAPVSVGRRTIRVREPFCVMGDANPMSRAYPLPERSSTVPVQARRRLSARRSVPRHLEPHHRRDVAVRKVSNAAEIIEMRGIVRSVPVPENAQSYAAAPGDGDSRARSTRPSSSTTWSRSVHRRGCRRCCSTPRSRPCSPVASLSRAGHRRDRRPYCATA